MRRQVAVVGYGCVGIGRYPNISEDELASDVLSLALENAGLSTEDVEGLVTTPNLKNIFMDSGLQASIVAEQMRIAPKSMAQISCGGVAAGLAIKHAMNEIMLGHISVAICYGAERERSMRERLVAQMLEHPPKGPEFLDPTVQPFTGFNIIWAYACSGRRYMHECDATEEQFAMASVRNRKNAVHNPWAAFKEPIEVEDVLNSRPLCSPIKLLDSCAALDGAAAVVLASEEKAKKITDTPVYIKAVGEYHDNSCCVPTDQCDKSLTTFIAAKKAAEYSFKQAKLKPSDIDVAEIYAPFSPQELILPEDLGWFKKGEMVEAIEDGSTEIGGRIPINTDGGLLSRGHPSMVTPFYETINVVRQLRGEAGKLQVDRAETGLMHCEGGTINNCMVFIFQRGD
ncbi:MAG: thiolase family protein [Candidatus Bathyarchaeota archaeon]|nr:thiolase family protein [Candidatus Bathyarchaeota archaeon]MDH5732386.1 thiolase family protein [Candidatus Bathyarchaeota archaeon]